MKLSTRARYGVTAMYDLAVHGRGKPITAAEISKRQGIALAYLEQILSKLRRARLVKSVRGPHGGYILAQRPVRISIGDIIRAADGPVALASCVPFPSACHKSGCCSTRALWTSLSRKVTRLFDSTSLKNLCKEALK
jgi:Rrf2 family cysteine metabolism transcriptional repressor